MDDNVKKKIENDLRQLYADGLSFETSAEEIDLKPETEEYRFANEFWNKLCSEDRS